MSLYIGRFAPSPTGPLHAGSLATALASWVDAKHHQGSWLLRIEDIDPDREESGATRMIIDSLDAHGLSWDSDVSYQSRQSRHYDLALAKLRAQNRLFACHCTRKHLRSVTTTEQPAYQGYCRSKSLPEGDRALRVKVDDGNICFTDLLAGLQTENLTQTTGDFIVRRRGPLYAYQLAVVVDDAHQGITHIVRGADLLDNTARQIALQRILDYPTPKYLHLPTVHGDDGRKLSKQTGAMALDNRAALDNLRLAWHFLGQKPVGAKSPQEFLQRAITQWERSRISLPNNRGCTTNQPLSC